jgi:hypothetical protein
MDTAAAIAFLSKENLMGSNWQKGTTLQAFDALPIAEYRAVISDHVETSSLVFTAGVDARRRSAALKRAPEWTEQEWPTDVDASSPVAQTYLALSKIKALLDFGARLDGQSADEIQAAVSQAFPHSLQRKAGVARYEVRAIVDLEGLASWGVRELSSGDAPAGASGSFADDRSDLQVLVQNLARADVQRQIEKMQL